MALPIAAGELVLVGIIAHLVIVRLFGAGLYEAIWHRVSHWLDEVTDDL